MDGKEIIFLLFAAITVGSAALVVFSRRIIYAAFSLMFSFFGVAALYVFLSADFLAAVQVIIYVGGILVLILFGILLTTKISKISASTGAKQRVWGSLTAIGTLALIFTILSRAKWTILSGDVDQRYSAQTETIGTLLMTDYLLPFEVASILLLAALIGSMFIVRSENK